MPRKQFPASLALTNQSPLAQPSYHAIQNAQQTDDALPQRSALAVAGAANPIPFSWRIFMSRCIPNWPSVTRPDARLDVVNRAVDCVVRQVGGT